MSTQLIGYKNVAFVARGLREIGIEEAETRRTYVARAARHETLCRTSKTVSYAALGCAVAGALGMAFFPEEQSFPYLAGVTAALGVISLIPSFWYDRLWRRERKALTDAGEARALNQDSIERGTRIRTGTETTLETAANRVIDTFC